MPKYPPILMLQVNTIFTICNYKEFPLNKKEIVQIKKAGAKSVTLASNWEIGKYYAI